MYISMDDIPITGMILKSGRGKQTFLVSPEDETPAVPKTAVYSLTILGVPLHYINQQKLQLNIWRFIPGEEGRERFLRLGESSDWKIQAEEVTVIPDQKTKTYSVTFNNKIKFTQSSYSRNGTHRFGFVITLMSGSTLVFRSVVFRVVSRKPTSSNTTNKTISSELSSTSNLPSQSQDIEMIFDLDSGDIVDSWIQ